MQPLYPPREHIHQTRERQANARAHLARSSKNFPGGVAAIFAVNDDVLADLRTAATKPHKHKGCQPKLFDPEEEGTEGEARYTLTRTSSNASKNRVSELSWEDMDEDARAILPLVRIWWPA